MVTHASNCTDDSKLKVIKNDIVVYECEAEELPEELKDSRTKSVKIQPELAII